MTNKSIFRILIIMSWVLTAASMLASHLLSSQLPDLLQQYEQEQEQDEQELDEESHTLVDDVPWILGLVAFAALLISNIGLFLFRIWSRPLYLISYGALLTLLLIDGQPYIENAVESFFAELATLVDGAIIGLAYFPTITKEFH
jgi:hypothetical protein